ncbi:MAG: cupin domain-containing protein [Gemmatimonadetes bacterium]|nr:cupin domain-containing protein [Gemmatimonadota bacterium]
MNALPIGPGARDDRPATALLYDHPNARIVAFHLLPGQQVAEHRSTSTVTVHVTEGSGVFRGSESESRLETGQIAVFEPDEVHSIDAGAEPLRFVAIITPRPGG